jgi:hypothetical protein
MHVVFGVARDIKVDYDINTRDVESSTCNICGNKNATLSSFEFVE